MTGDTGGAPHAAAGPVPEEIREALDALRAVWAPEYAFGFDPGKGYWGAESGKPGSLLAAWSPKELNELLAAREGAGR